MDSNLKHVRVLQECDIMGKVLLDFHIMQNCDIGVISQSGFGILAMWNRKEPLKDLYVLTRKNKTELEKDLWNRKNLTFVKYNTLDDILVL